MGPLDVFFQLLSFAAPAFAVAVLVALAAPMVLPRQSTGLRWWGQAAINFVVGVLVLVAGLWHFGVDGKMATYGVLAAAIASCQWACGRAWRA